MIIVGTHLDQISEKEDDILKAILTIYSDRYTYPEIASVCCIANGDTIDNGGSLKEKIYNVATHLYIAKQNKCMYVCVFLCICVYMCFYAYVFTFCVCVCAQHVHMQLGSL